MDGNSSRTSTYAALVIIGCVHWALYSMCSGTAYQASHGDAMTLLTAVQTVLMAIGLVGLIRHWFVGRPRDRIQGRWVWNGLSRTAKPAGDPENGVLGRLTDDSATAMLPIKYMRGHAPSVPKGTESILWKGQN